MRGVVCRPGEEQPGVVLQAAGKVQLSPEPLPRDVGLGRQDDLAEGPQLVHPCRCIHHAQG